MPCASQSTLSLGFSPKVTFVASHFRTPSSPSIMVCLWELFFVQASWPSAYLLKGEEHDIPPLAWHNNSMTNNNNNMSRSKIFIANNNNTHRVWCGRTKVWLGVHGGWGDLRSLLPQKLQSERHLGDRKTEPQVFSVLCNQDTSCVCNQDEEI